MSGSSSDFLVVGLGNILRGDDGVAVHIIRRLKERYPKLANYALESDDLTRILDQWVNKDVIVIDALKTTQIGAGKVFRVDSLSKLPSVREKDYSTHTVGLPKILELATILNKRPKSFLFFGIVGESWALGSDLSAVVTQQIPKVSAQVVSHILGRNS